MKILIPVIGSRGDIQPFMALAQGLSSVGHAVTITSHPVMRQLVEAHGVRFVSMGPDINMSVEAGRIRDRSRSPIIGLINVMKYAFRVMENSHDDLLQICHDAGLLVVHAQSAFGKNEAELLDLPYMSVTFMPWAIPWDDPERPLYKRVGYRLFDRFVSLLTTRPLNSLRRRQGLPPVGAEGFMSSTLNMIPISQIVYPTNPYWQNINRMVGYWFVDDPFPWEPPKHVLKFLEADQTPLVVSLGAMSFGETSAREAVDFILEAINMAGVRAIIQGWGDILAEHTLPNTICLAGAIPHHWLLPRTAGIVHHGGFGTTAAGFRAGIPQLVIPHLADQFFWGKRVEELGVGLPAIMRGRLSVDNLSIGLKRLVSGHELRTNAQDLGKIIRTEVGVLNAVELIGEVFIR